MVGTKQTGDVKDSMGNGEAKELVCVTQGHELRSGNVEGSAGCRVERDKGGKKWDNCNNIINKIYIFKKCSINQYLLIKNLFLENYTV